MKIDIAFGLHREAVKWKNKKMPWTDLVHLCSETKVTHETVKEYFALDRKQQDAIKDVGAFVPGLLNAGSRRKDNVIHKQVLALDLDFAPKKFWKLFASMYDCAAFAYTTHKHTPNNPRWRLCVLMDRPLMPDEYEPVCRRVADNLGIDYFDSTTYDVNRFMYFPSTSKDGQFLFKEQEGDPLCADDVLDSYDDYLDIDEWPIGDSEKKAIRHGAKVQGDPLEKPGWIGAFCRTYSVTDVLETILSDKYEPTDKEDRWTYVDGTTGGGLVLFEDKFAYSFHSTDPISRKLCNAFDLCRHHLFGELDGRTASDAAPGKVPSFIAMTEYAMKDKAVVKLASLEKFEDAGASFAEFFGEETAEQEIDWIGKLGSAKNGEYHTDYVNIRLIIENDPNLKNRFGLNLFTQRLEVRGKLPWNKSKKQRLWSDDDWKGLRLYLGEAPYKLKRTPMLEDVMGIVKHMFGFHPIKEYIELAEWDGKKRVDRLFIDYFGCEDTEYTRAVTRKSLVACVARIYDPGCQFEYVLTLSGEEGYGKSEILKRLGGKMHGKRFHSDSFNFGMVTHNSGQKAYELIQSKWIVETGEMVGLKGADDLAVKNFIASEEDSFRPSYGHELVSMLRHTVFFGTSNPDDFLKGKWGNRRFWPAPILHTEPVKDIWEDFTAKEVSQVWAEAKILYDKGEPLFLSDEIEAVARQVQASHVEKDDREELILSYLDMYLPEDWNSMSSFEKSNYFESYGTGESTGYLARERVSAAEIWVECLGGQKDKMTTSNTKFIHDILRAQKKWQRGKSRTTFKDYGNQIGYFRKNKNINSINSIKTRKTYKNFKSKMSDN